MKRGLVTVANEQVPIATVCRMLGVQIPDESERIGKLHCPFEQLYHSDGGIDPAMRVYPDSNTAFCFSCTVKFTPVGMWAQARDLHRRDAAVQLLDHVGYKPVDLAAAWQQVQHWEPEPDRSQLADALKTFCRRVDTSWRLTQFEPGVAPVLSRCLALLDLVRTAEDAQLWLVSCKSVMRHALQSQEPS